MYLYDKNDDKIEIYSLNPDCVKVNNYKREQMEEIPLDKRIVKALTNDIRYLENVNNRVNYSRLNYEYSGLWEDSFYHELKAYGMTNDEKSRQAGLLEKYYTKNDLFGNKVLEVSFSLDKDINYLLLTKSYYERKIKENDDYVMDNIINIPKSLYLYELFNRGNFELIDNESLNEILSLYNFSGPIANFSNEELRMLDKFELTTESESSVERKVLKSQKVLSLIK